MTVFSFSQSREKDAQLLKDPIPQQTSLNLAHKRGLLGLFPLCNINVITQCACFIGERETKVEPTPKRPAI